MMKSTLLTPAGFGSALAGLCIAAVSSPCPCSAACGYISPSPSSPGHEMNAAHSGRDGGRESRRQHTKGTFLYLSPPFVLSCLRVFSLTMPITFNPSEVKEAAIKKHQGYKGWESFNMSIFNLIIR